MTLPFVVTGCFYGYGTDTSVTRLTEVQYPPTASAELYFRPPTPEERCVPLALLEVQGSRFEETDSVLSKMRDQATEIGADSIFSVTAGATARTEGELIGELDPKNKPTVYSSHLVTGLAARCDIRTTANTKPPDGAYGYTFGEGETEVAAKCRAHGSEWRESPTRCIGAPASHEGPVAFGFCNDGLCTIEGTGGVDPAQTVHEPWPVEFVRTSAALIQRYGLPSTQNSQVPRGCDGRRLLMCVGASTAGYTYQWKWETGESVWLLLTAEGRLPVVRTHFDRLGDHPGTVSKKGAE